MTYLNLCKKLAEVNEKTNLVSLKEFNSKENWKKFQIIKGGIKELYGQKIHIVVIPKNTRIKEFILTGGAMAQPWFLKDDVSRVAIHEEVLEFAKESKENLELLYQMTDHEIGHLISMSNDFTQEFDSTIEGGDEREIYNIKCWIQKNDLYNKPYLESTFGEYLEEIIKAFQGLDILGMNATKYMQYREDCANYYAAQMMKKKKQEPHMFKVMYENIFELFVLLSQGITMDLGTATNMAIEHVKESSREELEELREVIEEDKKPTYDMYFRWVQA